MIQDERLPLKEEFLRYYKTTPIQNYACKYIGRSEDTIGRWKKEDQDFADCINKLKAEYVREKLNDVRSSEWILERVFKGDFAARQEFTGANGEPLVIIKDANTTK